MINTDEMQAGQELDVIVAAKIMEWVLSDRGFYYRAGHPESHNSLQNWKPSTDIAAAWLVVEKLTGPKVNLILERDWDGVYYSRFSSVGASEDFCSAYTAPLAICRAALNSVSE